MSAAEELFMQKGQLMDSGFKLNAGTGIQAQEGSHMVGCHVAKANVLYDTDNFTCPIEVLRLGSSVGSLTRGNSG